MDFELKSLRSSLHSFIHSFIHEFIHSPCIYYLTMSSLTPGTGEGSREGNVEVSDLCPLALKSPHSPEAGTRILCAREESREKRMQTQRREFASTLQTHIYTGDESSEFEAHKRRHIQMGF